jgi:hypothetical protein
MPIQFGKNAGVARVLLDDGPHHAGMGIVVSPRHVLTCAHVANTAIGRPVQATLRPTQELGVDFPLSALGERRYGHVGPWSPMGRMPEYDVAVIELTEDVPADVGIAVFAEIRTVLDGDPLSVFGAAAREPNGHHVDAKFMGSCSEVEVQIDGVKTAGVFVQRGYSGAAAWDSRHAAVVGMVRAVHTGEGVQVAYMVPTLRIAAVWSAFPYEVRRLPFLLNWLWTLFATLFLGLIVHFFWVVQAAAPDEHPQLAAFTGMHLYVVGAALLGGLWYLHTRSQLRHDWSARVPRFAGIDLGPDVGANRTLSTLSLVLFVLVPLYAQGHFLRTFLTQGHVYIYSDDFGYTPSELPGCLGRHGLCQHLEAGRFSTVHPRPPAQGGYWNNAYQYGDARPGTRQTVTFWPILQPLAVFFLTGSALVLQALAARATFSRPRSPDLSAPPPNAP